MANEIELTESEIATSEGAQGARGIAAGMCTLSGVRVVRAYADRLPLLVKIAGKVAKLAARLGCDAPRFQVHGESPKGTYLTIAVYGSAPRLEGYTFLARIEHTAAGNLISAIGDGQAMDLTAYRTAAPDCAHCNAARRRRDTFLLRREADGAIVQIGRNCLADFIRSADVGAALKVWDLLSDFSAGGDVDPDEIGGYGGGGRGDISTGAFLTFAVASVRTNGFRKSGQDGATRYDVAFLSGRPPKSRDPRAQDWADRQPTAADAVRATAIRAWLVSNPETGDYMYNLRIAATLPDVGRNAGLLASAPSAYARAVEKVVQTKREAATPPKGGHVGAIGVRVELGDLTVVRVRTLDSDWGTRTIVAAETPAGDAITWFASGAKDFNAGDVLVAARATIKKHDAFKGRPQTVVSRLACTTVRKAEITPE